jgi:hypothetical protein
MSRTRDDFELLIPAADSVAARLAQGLLEAEGIPARIHNADFDMAELGTAAHDRLRRPDVLVPKGTLERARELLDEAWGAGWQDRYVTTSPTTSQRARWGFLLIWLLVPTLVGVIALVAWFVEGR